MSERELEGQEQQGASEEEVEEQEQGQEADKGEVGEKSAAQPSEVEALAREMGWAPKTEWRGPAESWKTASDYIRRGTEIQRELKTRNDQIARDYEQRFQRLDRATQTALTKQREQLHAQFEAEKRQAVTLGDVQAYETVTRQQTEALKRFDEEAAEVQPKGSAGQDHPPEVRDFAARNIWFDKDPIMTDVAVGISKGLATRYPAMPLDERLSAVEKEMRRRFPEEFGQSNNNGNGNASTARPPQVEGGLRPIKSAKGKDWESMPNEAKNAGKKYIQQGLFKDQAEYAKSYWEQ